MTLNMTIRLKAKHGRIYPGNPAAAISDIIPTGGIVNPRPSVARTGHSRSFVARCRAASAPVQEHNHLGERGVPRLAANSRKAVPSDAASTIAVKTPDVKLRYLRRRSSSGVSQSIKSVVPNQRLAGIRRNGLDAPVCFALEG